ncbi:MAG TPA: DUF1990 domain-containing protein, partial [Ilumatobacteraceae bacterium]
DLPWTVLFPPDARAEPGTTVAIAAHHAGLWSVNACRVVYTIDDERGDGMRVSGFAIGTLPEHLERGEERFTIEHHDADDSVWFELYSFAKLKHWLPRLVAPFASTFPHRFAREAAARFIR